MAETLLEQAELDMVVAWLRVGRASRSGGLGPIRCSCRSDRCTEFGKCECGDLVLIVGASDCDASCDFGVRASWVLVAGSPDGS